LRKILFSIKKAKVISALRAISIKDDDIYLERKEVALLIVAIGGG